MNNCYRAWRSCVSACALGKLRQTRVMRMWRLIYDELDLKTEQKQKEKKRWKNKKYT